MGELHRVADCVDPVLFARQLSARALVSKYSSNGHHSQANPVNKILGQCFTSAGAAFRRVELESDDTEYLKRMYKLQEFQNKICCLSEYYKFTRHLPRGFDFILMPIILRYYNNLRKVDFRRVKAVLKQEENISLSSEMNSSSMLPLNGQGEKVLQCSNLLKALDGNSQDQSNILRAMCDNIGQAFKEVKVCPFKGEFKSGTKEFEKFLVKGQKECQRSRFEHRLTRRKNIYNIHSMKDIDMPKVVPYTFNLLKSKPKASLKKRSLQKTTANETISREEGLRKEKNNIMQTFSLQRRLLKSSSMLKVSKLGAKNMKNIYLNKPNLKLSLNVNQLQANKHNSHGENKQTSKSTNKIIPRQSSRSCRSHRGKVDKEPRDSHKQTIETDRVKRYDSKTSFKSGTLIKALESKQNRQLLKSSHGMDQVKRIVESRQNVLNSTKEMTRSISKPKLSRNDSGGSIRKGQCRTNACNLMSKRQQSHRNMTQLLSAKLSVYRR